jgi:large subunit ribosomal protein L25
MEQPILKAETRTVTGRKTRHLRKEGILPANIFGKKIKSLAISVKLKDFNTIFKSAGETTLVKVELEDKGKKDDRSVLIANVQKDPVSELPIHVDFHQVDLKEKVTASVPVELTGESPAEKLSVGTVVLYINEIEVEALPTDLPEKFIVDVSELSEVDQAIYVKDLKIDKTKVEIKADIEAILVKVEPPQKEEVVVPPPTEETAEGTAPTEGQAPAEGGEQPAQEAKASEEKPQEGK